MPQGVHVDYGLGADAGSMQQNFRPQAIVKKSALFGPNFVTFLTAHVTMDYFSLLSLYLPEEFDLSETAVCKYKHFLIVR